MPRTHLISSSLIALLLPAAAWAQTDSIWSSDKGYQPAAGCQGSVEATLDSQTVYEMTNETSQQIGRTGVDLAGTFWQVARAGSGSVVLRCGTRSLVAYDVFVAGSREPVARVAMADAEAARFFAEANALTPEQAAQIAQERTVELGETLADQSNAAAAAFAKGEVDDGAAANLGAAPESEDVAPMMASLASKMVVCVKNGLQVRDASLRRVVTVAKRLEPATPVSGQGNRKVKRVGGHRYSYIKVQLSDRHDRNNTGWVAEMYVKTRAACLGKAEAAPAPAPAPAKPEPAKPEPAKPAPAAPAPSNDSETDLLAPNCAKTTILVAAKKNVAAVFGNRPVSRGKCALGVRLSLQKSGVGGIEDGLGNAIDYLAKLKQHGYVDSGLKDVTKAPAGAVLVFGGPKTSSYLRTGRYGRPPGNWVGHVTIKGGDGFYYTDGRTREPAVGWKKNVDVENIRPLYAIMVPGKELVRKYADQCK